MTNNFNTPHSQSYSDQNFNLRHSQVHNRGTNRNRNFNRYRNNYNSSYYSNNGFSNRQCFYNSYNNPINNGRNHRSNNLPNDLRTSSSDDGGRNMSNQRDDLIYRVKGNKYECMICVEYVKRESAIWHCNECYNIFHIQCIRKWSKSCVDSSSNSFWRCPACQFEYKNCRISYECYCRKMLEPGRNRILQSNPLPHSCGDVCGRNNKLNSNCPHLCTLICHPGPCPNCEASITGECYCGYTKMTVKCNLSDTHMSCGKTCNKLLNCQKHNCNQTCHPNICEPCKEEVIQFCYCTSSSRTVPCQAENLTNKYSCEQICNRLLNCGNHKCQQICHEGECKPCLTTSDNMELYCPCGSTKVDQSQRTSCLDAIETCENICNKQYSQCPHSCQQICHDGPCQPCLLTSNIQCRCKKTSKNMKCVEIRELIESGVGIRCTTKCKSRKLCGIHRCQDICCPSQLHYCTLICNKPLSCGLHTCQETCHAATTQCGSCPNVSFEESHCTCGRTVCLPPIPCGSPLPECSYQCIIPSTCTQHPNPSHQCHDPNITPCPPCTYLTSKPCPKNHTVLHNIPCYRPVTTCGMKCNLPLAPNCQHSCQKLCHSGECPLPCTQLCNKSITPCQHPCSLPCHSNDPESQCLSPNQCVVQVTLNCQCNHLTQSIACNRLANLLVLVLNSSNPITTYDIVPGSPPYLACNNECKKAARLKQLAEAFGPPDKAISDVTSISTSNATNTYNGFLKSFSINNPDFLISVDKEFVDLIRRLETEKQTKVIYRFSPMNKEKRRFIHELAEHFCLTTYSFDPEPNRHVAIEAKKGYCKIPNNRLLIIMQKNYPSLFKSEKNAPYKHVPIPKNMINSVSYADKMKSIKNLKIQDDNEDNSTNFN